MANVGNLTATLTLQSAQFTAAMKAAAAQSKATQKAVEQATKDMKNRLDGIASAFFVDQIKRITKASFDYSDAIQDLSDRTGASTDMIQQFGYAAQLSGSSVENARMGIEKLAKNMGEAANGNKEMRDTLLSLGVPLEAIRNGDTDTAIKKIADGISKMDNTAARAAMTVKLFGKSGQDLTATLSDGSAGLSDFAKRAQQLGIVLDAKLIANAGAVNDKLDTMKMILDAKMASTVVKNANSIVSLADSFTKLSSSLLDFWAKRPEAVLGILGALGGARVGGGWGALAGGAIGLYAGSKVKQSMDDGNMDLPFRLDKEKKARADWNAARNASKSNTASMYAGQEDGIGANMSTGADLKQAQAEYDKQRGLLYQAIQAAKVPARPKLGANGGVLKDIPGPKGSSKEDHSAEKAAAATKAFEDQRLQAEIEGLRQSGELKPNIIDQSAIQREINRKLFDKDTSDINGDLATGKYGTGEIAKARADQLRKLAEQNFMLEADNINAKENETLRRQALDVTRSNLANDNEVQQGSLDLARTQGQRRAIMLRILDNQLAQEKAEAEATLASNQATDAEKQIAQARLNMLPTLQKQGEQSIAKQTLGPGAAYLDSIPKDMAEIGESVQSVAVDAFEKLNDSISDAITGTGSLKDAVGDMAKFVISSLIKIAVQQAIIKPLAGALFGGSGGGIFGSLFGAHANGGYAAAGMYMIGERGPELLNVGQPSSVVTTRELRGMGATNDNGRGSISVVVNGVNDPAMVRRMVQQGISEALPTTTRIGTAATLDQTSYPRMR